MTSFDERFADRAREVFDAYAEPVDEPTWERVQATLATTRTPAPDRAPIAGAWTRRSRALVALATLVLVGGVGSWAVWQTVSPDPEVAPVAVTTDTPPSTPVVPGPERSEATETPDAPEDVAASSAAPADPPLFAAGPSAPGVLAPARRSAPSPARQAPAPDQTRRAAQPPASARAEASDRAPESAPPPEAPPSDLAGAAQSGALEAELLDDVAPPSPLVAAAPAVTSRTPRETDAHEESLALGEAATPESSALGVDLVLSTNAAFSGRQLAEGAGLTAGLSREWRVRNGLAISTGALATYTRLATDPDASVSEALTAFESDPSRAVDVPSQTTLSTVALEVPLDVLVDVTEAGRGRIRAGVGLTTSLYLAQTFEDEGDRYALETDVSLNGESTVTVTSDAYSSTETAKPLSRLDLGRQANVSLGYTLDRGRTPLSVEAYTRLPLGGLTSRDLSITLVGLRLRVGL